MHMHHTTQHNCTNVHAHKNTPITPMQNNRANSLMATMKVGEGDCPYKRGTIIFKKNLWHLQVEKEYYSPQCLTSQGYNFVNELCRKLKILPSLRLKH